MTQKEFEARTKLVLTAEDYEIVDDIYMATGNDMDKDIFCRLYMSKEGRLSIMQAMATESRKLSRQLDKARLEAAEARSHVTGEMADWLIEQSDKWSATDLRYKAIEILGAREYLRRKLERKMRLWDEDLDLLLKLI